LGLSLSVLMGTTARGDVAQIDALLTTGYYIDFENTSPINLTPDARSSDPYRTFRGCMETYVRSNFNARLVASARPMSPAGGDWTVSITPPVVPAGQVRVGICILGKNVNVENLVGGTPNQKVAEIRIEVIAE